MKNNNRTKFAILGALNMDSGSGYDMKKFFDFSISHFWNENYAHIYPVLKEMEGEALVTSTQEKSSGRPAKSIYSITDAGREELTKWLEKPVEPGPARNELLLKLFFSGNIPKEKIINVLEDKKSKLRAELDQYLSIEDLLKSQEPYKSSKGQPLWLATISYGKIHSTSGIQWCDETIKVIQDMKD